MVGAAPRRVRHLRLQMRTVVQKRVIPCPGALLGARVRHEGSQLPIPHALAVREQLVQEHRAHVRLQVERGAVEGERHDAGRRGRADTGQLHQLLGRAGQLTAALGGAEVGRPLQRKGTAVVAEPLPLGQNVGRVGRRKRVDRGEQRHEALPEPPHARHLRLLEHDLGHEHGVGIVEVAPRKVAVKSRPPLAHERRERLAVGHGGRPRGPRAVRQRHGPCVQVRRAHAQALARASDASRGTTAPTAGEGASPAPMAPSTTGWVAPCSNRSLSVMDAK